MNTRIRFFVVALLALLPAGQVTVAETPERAVAIFAGGCFWCMQPPYDKLEGVLDTEAGFIGGKLESPAYEQVAAGNTDHLEAVRVWYDPGQVTYKELLAVFWRNIDPLDDGGQFCDRGDHYRAAIFVVDDKQKQVATLSRQALADSGRFDQPIVTEIRPADTFYPAEDYHQDYYKKRPLRYKYYRFACGREARLAELWGGR